MKYKGGLVAMALLVSCAALTVSAANEKHSITDRQQKISAQAAQEHIWAAEQLEESAGHHRKVAEFYKAGKFEEAGWNAYMAYAHSLRAQEHINAAAMLHLSERANLSDKAEPAEPKP